jgi:hypothetical protein
MLPNMPPIRLPFPSRRLVPRLIVALAWSSASLSAADTALSEFVRKFTEKRIAPAAPLPASPPVATATKPESDAKKSATRKPSPPLASLPAPRAGGPRRILLVDDDWNGNTASEAARPSGSDTIFRDLVAAAVGGEAAAWSNEMVETSKSGPAFERLRDFNVVVWYTGESYGGSADSVATLSTEDEKTVRRYLQEVGGAFVLISPGFLSTRSYGTTWTESDHAFLREVMGVHGVASMVQRFAAGTVRATDGSRFEVEAKGVIETQFSAVNPDGAAVVFSTALDPRKTAEGAVPVAVAHPYGGGRFVYVGFSFENIAQAGRAKAFGLLLDAATGPRPTVVTGAPRVTPAVVQGKVGNQRIMAATPLVSPPPVFRGQFHSTAAHSSATRTES